MTSHRNTTVAPSSTVAASTFSPNRAPRTVCMMPCRTPSGLRTDALVTASLNASWASDYLSAMSAFNLPAPGENSYSLNWSILSERTRKKLAHARLIDGDYGVNLEEPCEYCHLSTQPAYTGRRRQCRVYIRSLKVRQNYLGVACSACRANSTFCSLAAKEPEPKNRNKGGRLGPQTRFRTNVERRDRKNEPHNSLRSKRSEERQAKIAAEETEEDGEE